MTPSRSDWLVVPSVEEKKGGGGGEAETHAQREAERLKKGTGATAETGRLLAGGNGRGWYTHREGERGRPFFACCSLLAALYAPLVAIVVLVVPCLWDCATPMCFLVAPFAPFVRFLLVPFGGLLLLRWCCATGLFVCNDRQTQTKSSRRTAACTVRRVHPDAGN